MLTLKAKIRSLLGKDVRQLREKDRLPAVLYGPGLKENFHLEMDTKEFIKVFQETGRSSFLQLEVEKDSGKPQVFLVLVHDIQKDPLSLSLTHVDFYQPSSTKEIRVRVPLVFEGGSSAVSNLGGTLVKNIQEVQVQALPQNLPHEITVNLESLNEVGKTILVKDLLLPAGVKIIRNPEEIIVQVMEAEKIEEELAHPVEEKVEEVKVVEKEKKEKEEGTEAPAAHSKEK
ncbi:MAG: 50S ribosomal protein L25 [Candidatus Nealsonbacteria bacterium]|nr:50S ribosomal protein L25 [Candidatus Nealsonbacteria bacterium]